MNKYGLTETALAELRAEIERDVRLQMSLLKSKSLKKAFAHRRALGLPCGGRDSANGTKAFLASLKLKLDVLIPIVNEVILSAHKRGARAGWQAAEILNEREVKTVNGKAWSVCTFNLFCRKNNITTGFRKGGNRRKRKPTCH